MATLKTSLAEGPTATDPWTLQQFPHPLRRYIDWNPVKAALVAHPEE
jgi:hypothetical protein